MSDVVTVSPQETRVEPVKASSPSWFIARINAVSRIIGALLLCVPMFIVWMWYPRPRRSASNSCCCGLVAWLRGPYAVRPGRYGSPPPAVLSPCSSTAAPRARSCGRVAGL